MKFLLIGLGSMGQRRIRCLTALGHLNDITAYDIKPDRRTSAREKYGIEVVDDLSGIFDRKFDCMIISVPPDIHNVYIKKAIENNVPAFVEASVVLGDLEELNELAKKKGVFIAPSCTMLYHPSIKDIKSIIESKKYGKLTNFSYHSGQYLPDWHPWEKVTDYYVSNKLTGGGREIVPFELTWIVDLIGFPKSVKGFYGKTMDVGADIDDTYTVCMDFGYCFGTLTVDVVSRYATRSLILNFEKGQVLWNWNEGQIKVYDAQEQRWIYYKNPAGTSVSGYNINKIDDMYIEELKAFIDAISDNAKYPNTLPKDIAVLKILLDIEK